MKPPLEILLWSAACAATAAGWIVLALRVRRHLQHGRHHAPAPPVETATGRDA